MAVLELRGGGEHFQSPMKPNTMYMYMRKGLGILFREL